MFIDKLDSMTLAFSIVLLQITYIIGFSIASINSNQKYLVKMTFGILLNATGHLLIAVADSELAGILLGTTILILGYVLMIYGLCDLIKQRIKNKLVLFFFIIHLIVFSYLIYIRPIFKIRTSFFSFEVFLMGAFTFYVSFKYFIRRKEYTSLSISLASLLYSCFHLYRIYTVMNETNPLTLFREAHMSKYIYIATILYNSCLCISVVLLATRIHFRRLNNINRCLKELSYKDPLTKSYNLRYIVKVFENLLYKVTKEKLVLSIAIIDIDYFKKINDTYGHMIGDEVLKKLVELINQNISKTDFLGRYGGEEFLLILPDKRLSYGVKLIEKLQNILRENVWKYDNLQVTFSAGIIEIDEKNVFKEAKHLINDVDSLLYKAKKNGRDRVEY